MYRFNIFDNQGNRIETSEIKATITHGPILIRQYKICCDPIKGFSVHIWQDPDWNQLENTLYYDSREEAESVMSMHFQKVAEEYDRNMTYEDYLREQEMMEEAANA